MMKIVETLKSVLRSGLKIGVIPLLGILFLYACTLDDETSYKGTLNVELVSDTTLVRSGAKATKGSFLELADFEKTDDYRVEILQGTETVQEYERYDKMPDNVSLEPGDYTIQVSKGKNEPAAFMSPYFEGKEEFKIATGMTTPVAVTAAMANSRVTVSYSDDFLETYKSYTLSFMTNKMKAPLVYETGQSMYFQSDAAGTKLTVAMQLVNVYGKEVEYSATVTIKPKQWTDIKVRTDEKGLNGLALEVTLNGETHETVYVNIGIPDFMEKLKGAPYVVCDAFDWDDINVSTSQPTEYEKNDKPVPVEITAGGKIAQILLTLKDQNTTLINQYDLVNLTEEQAKDLKDNYGFTMPEAEIKGTVSGSFDLQPVIASLLGKEGDSSYELSVTVKDALPKPNQTMKAVNIKVPAAEKPSMSWELFPKDKTFEYGTFKPTLNVAPVVGITVPAGIDKVLISIDGLNIKDQDINTSIDGIEIAEQTADYIKLKFTVDWFNTLSYGEDKQPKTYTVSFTVTDKLGRKRSESNSFTVTAPEFSWAMAADNGNIFARYAYLSVKAKDATKVTFYQNGQQITDNLVSLGRDESGVVTYVWKGLKENTDYNNITAKYDGKQELEAISFRTENVGTLPNSRFEEWTVGPDGLEGHGDYESMGFFSKDYHYTHKPYRSWERWYPYSGSNNAHWDTLNELTASVGEESETFSKIGMGNKRWTRYVANSGTIRTEGYNEGYAALIRTVGWGDGNTAGTDDGLIEGNSGTKTPGELYLGDYSSSSKYGISFTSRPKGFKFKYKYKAQNSDKFIAEIVLLNGNMQVVKATLDDSYKIKDQDWQEVKVLITDYTDKITSMYIRFVSGTSTATEDLMIKPGFGNLTTGEYVGSQLYIDDVELIYDYE